MKTLKHLAILAVVLLWTALGSIHSRAATVRGFSLADLTSSADEVVRGAILGSHSIWHRSGDMPAALYTITEVRVDRSFKGATLSGETLFVMQRGGQDAGIAQTVAGTVRFEDGDEVLLFARTDGAISYLVGMAQGAYFLRRPSGPTGIDRLDLTWTRGPQPTIANANPHAPLRPHAADAWQTSALETAIVDLIAAQRSAQ